MGGVSAVWLGLGVGMLWVFEHGKEGGHVRWRCHRLSNSARLCCRVVLLARKR